LALTDLARRQLAGIARVLDLHTLVIGEASRFPELGRAIYERGPGRAVAALTTAFERLAAPGRPALGRSRPRRYPVQLAAHVGADQRARFSHGRNRRS